MALLDECGIFAIDNLLESLDKSLALAAKIRKDLGESGYLLEEYLTFFLLGAYHCGKTPEQNGFDSTGELHSLIECAQNGKADKSPFYPVVKEYMDTHPLTYKEQTTQRSFYAIALYKEYIRYQANVYQRYLKEKLNNVFGAFSIEELRVGIRMVVDPKVLQELDNLLYEVFFSVVPTASLFQEMTGSFLHELTGKNPETQRYKAGLWLDATENPVT